jgi:hypothetical protein
MAVKELIGLNLNYLVRQDTLKITSENQKRNNTQSTFLILYLA